MSHSPAAAEGADPGLADRYVAGWRATNALVHRGGSWSGRERNCAFVNTGGGRFADISGVSGFDFPDDARAVSLVDWDGDGDLDVLARNRTTPSLRYLRNDDRSGNAFLEVRLSGLDSNRDGIGARVEVHLPEPDGRVLLRTLHAGEGFRSQSSRWLHFGLGRTKTPVRLVVRWPSGTVDDHAAVAVNQRLLVEEKKSQVTVRAAAGQTKALRPTTLPTGSRGGSTRLLPFGPVPAPFVGYRAFGSADVQLLTIPPERPVLVNLWATWCTACAGELTAMTTRAEEIRKAGLDVIALDLDGPGSDPPPDAEAAARFMATLGFPFQTGIAESRSVGSLQAITQALRGDQRALSLPASFLIGRRGRIAAIYLGAVDLDVLLRDARLLADAPALLAATALPRPGRWNARPQRSNLEALHAALGGAGLTEEAGLVLSAHAELDDGIAKAERGKKLLVRGEVEAALVELREAARLHPRHVLARLDLLDALLAAGNIDEAVAEARALMAIDPAHERIPVAAGRALLALSQGPAAAAAASDDAARAEARADLATSLAKHGFPDLAAFHARAALALVPGHPGASTVLRPAAR